MKIDRIDFSKLSEEEKREMCKKHLGEDLYGKIDRFKEAMVDFDYRKKDKMSDFNQNLKKAMNFGKKNK